jgi:hypothetical protein
MAASREKEGCPLVSVSNPRTWLHVELGQRFGMETRTRAPADP